MKATILVLDNGSIAKAENGDVYGTPFTGDFLIELQKWGFKVIYFARVVRKEGEASSFLHSFNLTEHGVRSIGIYGKRPKSYFSLIKLFIQIMIHKHVYIFYPGGLSSRAGKLCKLLGKKYGVYVRGFGQYASNNNRDGEYVEVLNNEMLLKKASYLITVSPKLQNDLLNLTNMEVKILKPMIKWDLKDIMQPIIKKYNSRKIKILFVGSVHERKGIYELIKVANILDKNNIDFLFNVVGDGALLEKLQNSKGSQTNIKFMGGIRDHNTLAKIFETSDIFFFPTRNEGFPRVLYEAMLKGLPIFTTMVSGIPGLMQHDYNCIELPVRDPEGQAKVIMENILQPEKLQSIAENGQKTVTEVLTKRKPHHEVLIDCIENAK